MCLILKIKNYNYFCIRNSFNGSWIKKNITKRIAVDI